jgi:two-component system, NtrC family, response regulator AlgB
MQVLVVDDEANIRRALATAIELLNYRVETAESGEEALAALEAGSFQVVFLDLKLRNEDGLDLVSEILRIAPDVSIVMLTAYATIETAVEAMRRGAFDFLAKPCTPEQVQQVLDRVVRQRRLEQRVVELESQLEAESPELELATDSPVMQRVITLAQRAAVSEANVLLQGESGTGKSVLARIMHGASRRSANAFITVSCPSLSRDLLESDLFGHVRGAFTGALKDAVGKVAAAEAGTLFLDEISEIPPEIQAKLLRLLQDREYERVGDTRVQRADVRVIAATNRDLAKEVASGAFREDLFYRLNVITLTLPPLRDRLVDLERLAERQLQFFSRRAGKSGLRFSAAASETMRRYHWPGNLRELRNVIERAVILSEGPEVGLEDLGNLKESTAEPRIGGSATLEQVEKEHIRRVLANSRTVDEAAATLGIDPATLYRRKKKL